MVFGSLFSHFLWHITRLRPIIGTNIAYALYEVSLSTTKSIDVFPKDVPMKRAKVFTCVRASILALSLWVLPITTPLSAQTPTPAPTTPRVETRVERDYTGLWGLLGLLGLAGLAGRRRPAAVQVYESPTQPPTGTQPRR